MLRTEADGPLSEDELEFLREQKLKQHVERIERAFWDLQRQAKEFSSSMIEIQREMKTLMAYYRKFKASQRDPKKS